MNIIQITDCHLFADANTTMAGVNTEQSLLKVLQAISENESPDLVLVTGDMAHDEELPTYRQLKDFLDKLNIKYYCLPGNHDQPQYLKETFKDNFIGQFQHFICGGWQIILLSTAIPGKVHGRLNNQQLTLLSRAVQENREPAVIFMHHQPVPIQCPWLDNIGLENPDEFLTILQSTTSVKAVFCGHVHQEFKHLRNNIVFYGTPSTCFQFKPHSMIVEYDNALPAYRSIKLNASGLHDTHVVRVEI
jgi:3',5'-cyclic-AMP phosphodiesterase